MNCGRILSIGTKVFNKKGFRLAQIVEESVPESYAKQGVKAIRLVTMEHRGGEIRQVKRFLNANNKAVRVEHTSSVSPGKKDVTNLEWLKPEATDNAEYARFMAETDPFWLTNKRVDVTRYNGWDSKKEIVDKITHSILDINPEHQALTKGTSVLIPSGISSEVFSTMNGKRTKSLFAQYKRQQNGTYKLVGYNSAGIGKKRINGILKDKYFYARFLSNKNFLKYSVPQAAENQSLGYIPRVRFVEGGEAFGGGAGGGLVEFNRQLYVSPRSEKACLLLTAEHEVRHLKQEQLVNLMEKGELKDQKLIDLAKAFKQNFENYIHAEGKNNPEYYGQLVEVDADKVGRAAMNLYDIFTAQLKKVFPYARTLTLGG